LVGEQTVWHGHVITHLEILAWLIEGYDAGLMMSDAEAGIEHVGEMSQCETKA